MSNQTDLANPTPGSEPLKNLFSGKNPSDEEPPPPLEQQFKGHPQPPIKHRLEEARNFLADEDPNRCLGFREKLAEIDEYLAYIKDQNFSFDDKLYRDVRSMAETHHEWDDRVQKGWIDTSCGTKPLIKPVSNRLLTGSQVEELQREREAMGVEEQMRDEDPPFCIERSGNYAGFIEALGRDSNQDPELLDDATNLLFVEGRAYDWAMREPAWIPYWMHSTKGLPNGPIKPEDEEPWYRKAMPLPLTLGRPPEQVLSRLVEKREKELNSLLAKGKMRTDKGEERLRILMHDHFPDVIKERWAAVKDQKKEVDATKAKIGQERNHALAKNEHAPHLQGHLNDLEIKEADLLTKSRMYQESVSMWYNWVQKLGGVQCILESDSTWREEAFPATLGVLIFPNGTQAEPTARTMVDVANRLLDYGKDHENYLQYNLEKSEQLPFVILLAWVPHLGESFSDELEEWYELDYKKKSLTLKERNRSYALKGKLLYPVLRFWQENINAVVMAPPCGEPGLRGGTLYIPFQESYASQAARKEKAKNRVERMSALYKDSEATRQKEIEAPKTKIKTKTNIDYTPQAERRGILRAAIELGLNLLCGNQEQHRPNDKFRIVQLPGPYVDWADIPELPLTIPLDPSHRPVELEPFYFTDKLARYRERKDFEYKIARAKAVSQRRGLLDPPMNFKGPFTVATLEQFQETIERAKDDYMTIYKRMAVANEEAPRPLMTRMLVVVDQGLRWEFGEPHPLVDPKKTLELTNEQIALLEEISGPSWDTLEKDLDDDEITPYPKARFEEFRHDLNDILNTGEIPFWEIDDPKPPIPLFQDKSFKETFKQQKHMPHVRSKEGILINKILKEMNDRRIAAKAPTLWAEEEAKRYFEAMRVAEMIHYDDQMKGEEMISQIPFQGHPENKYVLSLNSIKESPGVEPNETTGRYEVQYDAGGTIGPPIVQPNKYEYLQQLSMNLGRLIKNMLETIAVYPGNFDDELEEQIGGLKITEDDFMKNLKPNELSSYAEEFGPSETLKEIALELHTIAPDLAERAKLYFKDNDPENMTEQQAAILIQIQILEENNNNWESRFPENEHVWDFAAPRLIPVTKELEVGGEKIQVTVGPRKFFNMRRYPVGCQTEATQLAIKSSGPVVAQKSDAKKVRVTEPEQRPGEIYRGGNEPPFFPFGETPYQEAFQSWRMNQELADIPEFQIKNGGKDQPPPGRFIPALPELPSNFVPKSRTPYENRMREIKEMMKLPNAPDPNILENYYTQEEIMNIKRREAYLQRQEQVEEAHAAIAKKAGKEFKDMTGQEIQDVCAKLNIDPFEMKLPEPGKKTSEGRSTKRNADTQHITQTRSSKRTRREAREESVTEYYRTGISSTEGTSDDQAGDSFTGETGDEVTGDEVTGGETGEDETGVEDSTE